MKPILLACLLLMPGRALGSELTIEAVAGGDMAMAAGMGYGNLLTSSLWGLRVPVADSRLDSFSIEATAPAEGMAYRLAVGIVTDNLRWGGDVFTTPWLTDSAFSATIDGGLELTPGLNYIAYLVPQAADWTLGTTLTNSGPGVVGMAVLFYTDSQLVDGDLPHDRDVAMHATFSTVPEPSTFLLLGVGLLAAIWRHR